MAEASITAAKSSRLNWCIRLIGTAIGFISFGLGGLFFATVIVPVIWFLYRDPGLRAKRLRKAISISFLIHINILRVFGVLSYTVQERARLGSGSTSDQLIVANHPTLLDVVFLVAFVDNAICVVKDALFHNFYVGFVIRMAGYVSNKDPDALIFSCEEALYRGETVIIFPEGTRSTAGQQARLQRGAAYVALSSRICPTPVQISCIPGSLTKGLPWYSIPPSKMVFSFTVGAPIALADLLSEDRGRAARILNRRIEEQIFQ